MNHYFKHVYGEPRLVFKEVFGSREEQNTPEDNLENNPKTKEAVDPVYESQCYNTCYNQVSQYYRLNNIKGNLRTPAFKKLRSDYIAQDTLDVAAIRSATNKPVLQAQLWRKRNDRMKAYYQAASVMWDEKQQKAVEQKIDKTPEVKPNPPKQTKPKESITPTPTKVPVTLEQQRMVGRSYTLRLTNKATGGVINRPIGMNNISTRPVVQDGVVIGTLTVTKDQVTFLPKEFSLYSVQITTDSITRTKARPKPRPAPKIKPKTVPSPVKSKEQLTPLAQREIKKAVEDQGWKLGSFYYYRDAKYFKDAPKIIQNAVAQLTPLEKQALSTLSVIVGEPFNNEGIDRKQVTVTYKPYVNSLASTLKREIRKVYSLDEKTQQFKDVNQVLQETDSQIPSVNIRLQAENNSKNYRTRVEYSTFEPIMNAAKLLPEAINSDYLTADEKAFLKGKTLEISGRPLVDRNIDWRTAVSVSLYSARDGAEGIAKDLKQKIDLIKAKEEFAAMRETVSIGTDRNLSLYVHGFGAKEYRGLAQALPKALSMLSPADQKTLKDVTTGRAVHISTRYQYPQRQLSGFKFFIPYSSDPAELSRYFATAIRYQRTGQTG